MANSGLRVKIWALFLLGDLDLFLHQQREDVEEINISCDEQQVLDADVHRTRAGYNNNNNNNNSNNSNNNNYYYHY